MKEPSFLGNPLGKSSLRGEDAPTFLGQAGREKNKSRCSLSDLQSLRFPTRYYITRAKLVSKIAKYPHVVSRQGCFLGFLGLLVPVLERRVLWETGGWTRMGNACVREVGGGSFVKKREFGVVCRGHADLGPLSRASVCSLQEDYRRTVTEIDEKEYISLRLIISELRNQYVSGKPELPLASCMAI